MAEVMDRPDIGTVWQDPEVTDAAMALLRAQRSEHIA